MTRSTFKLNDFKDEYIHGFIDRTLKAAEQYPHTAVVVKVHERGTAVNVADRNDIPYGWRVVER